MFKKQKRHYPRSALGVGGVLGTNLANAISVVGDDKTGK